MKNIIIFLLLSFSAQAQRIDLEKISFDSDSTFTIPDTTYWEFTTIEFPRGQKTLKLYQADLIVWRGGVKNVNTSIGPEFWAYKPEENKQGYADKLRAERDNINRQINTLREAIDGLTIQRDAILNEIQNGRNR